MKHVVPQYSSGNGNGQTASKIKMKDGTRKDGLAISIQRTSHFKWQIGDDKELEQEKPT
jgi:hypothetical protein